MQLNLKFLLHSSLAVTLVWAVGALPLQAHGTGHRHPAGARKASQQEEGHHHHHHGKGHDHDHSADAPERRWGVELSSGWEGRHVHHGVDESGRHGAFTNELTLWYDQWSFQFWNGIGIDSGFAKYEFSLAYHLEAGPVFFSPGYRYRYQPGFSSEGHQHGAEEEAHEDHHGHHGHHGHEDDHDGEEGHGAHAHVHKTHGHELFAVLGTTVIPYVTPSVAVVWDVNNTPGAYVEFKVESDLELYPERLRFAPYALVGINGGYTSREVKGWNHSQIGGTLTFKINEHLSIYAGAHYSIPLEVTRSLDQPHRAWANGGLSFSY